MATGNYGVVRPSDVGPEDVEIILHYTPSRDETTNFTLTKLDSLQYLRPYYNNSNISDGTTQEIDRTRVKSLAALSLKPVILM